MWTPFAIDAKGGEMKTKGEMQTKGEHELLSSMTKGEIVDEIVIDANLVLQWPHGMSLDPRVDDDDLDTLDEVMESLEMGI